MTTEEVVTQAVIDAMRAKERAFLERDAPGAIQQTPEQIAATAAYWETVFSAPAQKPMGLAVIRSTAPEALEYDEAKKKVWALFQLRAAHIMTLEDREFEWSFDETERAIIQNLIRYFINDKGCAWTLTKGLFFYGAPGTGKTEIMHVFQQFCEKNELSKRFTLSSLSEIYVKSKSDKDYDPITTNVQYDRCFDELGRYSGPIVRFGDSLDINEAIIEQRYDRMKRYGQLTHFIANATPNQLADTFSPMVFDRLRSMCTGIHFQGKSKR